MEADLLAVVLFVVGLAVAVRIWIACGEIVSCCFRKFLELSPGVLCGILTACSPVIHSEG